VLGAAGDDAERGSAYVFVKPAAGWANLTETAKLTASDGATLDWFGYSAALDGDTIVIGAPGGPTGPSTVPGAVYIFVRPSGGRADMTQTVRLTASDGAASDLFGWSVAVSEDTIAAGAFRHDNGANDDQGSAYVFDKPTAGWIDMTETAQLTASDGAAGDGFGWSVAMDGDTLVAGAYTDSIDASQQGSAYVFSNDTRLRIYFPLIWR
jgi:hypothetical protein